MLHDERDDRVLDPRERELIVAYLSYALEDVRAISEVGSHFLQMTIATLADDASLDAATASLQPTSTH